jgi:hypothetical protein
MNHLIEESRQLTHHHHREVPRHILDVRQELEARHAAQSERETDEPSGPDAN